MVVENQDNGNGKGNGGLLWGIIAFGLFLLFLALCAGVVVSSIKAKSGPATLEPAVVLDQKPLPPVDLHLVLGAKLRNDKGLHTIEAMVMRSKDREHFFNHLENVAAGRGWHVHTRKFNQSARIIIPASEINEIRRMGLDPAGWIRNEVAANRPPQGPTSIHDLVNVGLDARHYTHDIHDGWVLAAVLFVVAALATLAFACAAVSTAIDLDD